MFTRHVGQSGSRSQAIRGLYRNPAVIHLFTNGYELIPNVNTSHSAINALAKPFNLTSGRVFSYRSRDHTFTHSWPNALLQIKMRSDESAFMSTFLSPEEKKVLLNEWMQCLGCYETHSTHIYLWYIMSLGSLTSCLMIECVMAQCLLKHSLRYNVYIAFRNWSRLVTFARGTKCNENCGFGNLSFSFSWVETSRVRSRPNVWRVCSCSFEGIWIVRRYTLETSTRHRVSTQRIHPRNVLTDESCLPSLLRAWTLKRLYISFWFT